MMVKLTKANLHRADYSRSGNGGGVGAAGKEITATRLPRSGDLVWTMLLLDLRTAPKGYAMQALNSSSQRSELQFLKFDILKRVKSEVYLSWYDKEVQGNTLLFYFFDNWPNTPQVNALNWNFLNSTF